MDEADLEHTIVASTQERSEVLYGLECKIFECFDEMRIPVDDKINVCVAVIARICGGQIDVARSVQVVKHLLDRSVEANSRNWRA